MKISILIYPGFTALDAVGPYEVLCRLPGSRVEFVAAEAGPVTTDSGQLSLFAERALCEVDATDVLLLPGGAQGTLDAARNGDLLEWIRRIHDTTQWTTSVCTGAVLLAEAGILAGKDATTHWLVADLLHRGRASFVPRRFVRDGKTVTAAGVSAGIDMAFWLAGEVAGINHAKALQLALEYDPQPPFDSGSAQGADPLLTAHAARIASGAGFEKPQVAD